MREQGASECYREQVFRTLKAGVDADFVLRIDDDAHLCPHFWFELDKVMSMGLPIVSMFSRARSDVDHIEHGRVRLRKVNFIHGMCLLLRCDVADDFAHWVEHDAAWSNKTGHSLRRYASDRGMGMYVTVPSLAQQRPDVRSALGHGSSRARMSPSFAAVYGEPWRS